MLQKWTFQQSYPHYPQFGFGILALKVWKSVEIGHDFIGKTSCEKLVGLHNILNAFCFQTNMRNNTDCPIGAFLDL